MSMSTAEAEAKHSREEAGGDHVPAHGKGTGKGTGESARQASGEVAATERGKADRELIAIGPTDI